MEVSFITKVIWSFIIIIPFIGPIAYGALYEPPLYKVGNMTSISQSEAITHALAADDINDR